jgi:hypothetical protein
MATTKRDVVSSYLAAQSCGDIDAALALIADDAVFDVGRGRYEGHAIREFIERLARIHSVTRVVELEENQSGDVAGTLTQRDDDLRPLGIDEIRLDVQVAVDENGRIAMFSARPTPESLATIARARDAGRTSEGVELAERSGNLPPPDVPDGRV